MRRSLELYRALDICGSDRAEPKTEVGSIRQNVERAMTVLRKEHEARRGTKGLRRILLFVGLRTDGAGGDSATPELAGSSAGRGGAFPAAQEKAVAALIHEAISREIEKGDIALAIAAGSNGGDILFHEQLHRALAEKRGGGREEPLVRLCLALPRPAYVGQYVAPAGGSWVERFSSMYRRIVAQEDKSDDKTMHLVRPVQVFADSADLPRWLHTKRHYNVGRRNNLWMLQHALTQAYELGEYTEITLLALVPATSPDIAGTEPAMGGVQDTIRRAAVQGIKVVPIQVPGAPGGVNAAAIERAAATTETAIQKAAAVPPEKIVEEAVDE
jgi:hypothetical protein